MCIDTLKYYLDMPNSLWSEERCAAMRWIARSYDNLNNPDLACVWYFKAIAEAPHMREPYIEFAQLCYKYGDYSMVYFLTEEALKIKEKSKTFVNMGYAWDHTPYDLAGIAAYNIGLMEKAYSYMLKAYEIAPGDERLEKNYFFIKNLLEKSAASN
ncbi:MAG: hypothetical protein GX891_05355 [Clostridiales bacterium]|nr:hypothetical protein [Clostridiales bacterium]